MAHVVRVLWILLALVATASAEPLEPALGWRAPLSCPGLGEVTARIERRLGRPVQHAVRGVAVAIVQDGGRFVARIDLGREDANDLRVLMSERCDALVDAVAVVLARLAAEVRPELPRAPSVEIPRLARPAPEPREWGGGVRALGISGIGVLPGISVGGEVAGYARRRATFVELAGTRWRRGQTLPSLRMTLAVRLEVLALRVGWRPEHVPLRAWLAGEIGTVEGYAQTPGDAGTGRWRAVGAGFGVAWPIALSVRLVGVIELAVPLEPARFLLRDGTEMARPEMAAVRSGLGLEVGWQ